MRGEGVPITATRQEADKPSITRAALFIGPALVVTVVSVLLFDRLTGLPEGAFNTFSVTVLAAIITSLLSATAMQILVYRIIEERGHFINGAAARSIHIGLIYSLVSTIIVSVIMYPYLTLAVGFSGQDFLYFVVLHFLFSGTWVVSSAFWATRHYVYPSVVFTAAFLFLYFFTIWLYGIDPALVIVGYTVGIAVLFMLSLFASVRVFPWPGNRRSITDDLSKLPKMDAATGWAIAFNTMYILAIFLDKIVIWVFQGQIAGTGLAISGIYTSSSFLGLIPLLSISSITYFNDRTKSLVEKRYQGTQTQIRAGIKEYCRIYRGTFTATIFISAALALLTIFLTELLFPGFGSIPVLATIAVGSVFLSGVMFNSVVLPIFGQSGFSTLAALMVVIGVVTAIPFLSADTWFAALGFMAGACFGFLISYSATARYLGHFEFNMFRFITVNTLKELNRKRSHLS